MITVNGLNEAVKDIEQKIERGKEKGMDALADKAKELFEGTSSTWNDKPTFTIDKKTDERTIGTEHEKYGWVSGGTKKHIILGNPMLRFPVSSVPKTIFGGTLQAGSGSRNPVHAYRRKVRHPGIRARKFDKRIADVVEKNAKQVMESEIQQELDK